MPVIVINYNWSNKRGITYEPIKYSIYIPTKTWPQNSPVISQLSKFSKGIAASISQQYGLVLRTSIYS